MHHVSYTYIYYRGRTCRRALTGTGERNLRNMYRVIKVLNNNGILVYSNETGREMILLGNGVGFGRKPTEKIGPIPGAKVYSLVSRRKDQSVLKVVNGIRPEFIEAAGKIIEEAEKEFGEVNQRYSPSPG